MKTQSEIKKSLFLKEQPKMLAIATKISIALIATVLLFTSCKKKEETPQEEDTEQSTATDNNIAENFVSDIETMGSQVSETGLLAYRSNESSGISTELSPSATVTINGQLITIDFGSVGCIGNDGRTRTGKLIYDFSASNPSSAIYYRNPGFKLNVTSQNYVVDNYSVTIINKTISNTSPLSLPLGMNPGTNLTWLIAANVSIVKPNNSGSISWSCSRTKELVNTSDTNCYKGQGKHIIWSKAVIKLNGNTTGTNAKNEQFIANATNLIRDFNCSPDPSRPMRHPFISGTISYSPGIRPIRLVDFGNGSCDFAATITVNSTVFNVTLP
jgi:hypothetical protein